MKLSKSDIDIEFTPEKTQEEQDALIEHLFAINQIPNSLLKKLQDSIERIEDDPEDPAKISFKFYLMDCYRIKKELHQQKMEGKPISFREQERLDWALGNVIRHVMDMIYWYEKWIADQKKEIERLDQGCGCCT